MPAGSMEVWDQLFLLVQSGEGGRAGGLDSTLVLLTGVIGLPDLVIVAYVWVGSETSQSVLLSWHMESGILSGRATSEHGSITVSVTVKIIN